MKSQHIERIVLLKNDLEKHTTMPENVKEAFTIVMEYIIETKTDPGIFIEKSRLVSERPQSLKRQRGENTKLKVRFLDSDKEFFGNNAKTIYAQSLEEIGFKELRDFCPNLFSKSSNDKDRFQVEPNLFLKVGLNNLVKRSNIYQAANALNRKVTIEILKG